MELLVKVVQTNVKLVMELEDVLLAQMETFFKMDHALELVKVQLIPMVSFVFHVQQTAYHVAVLQVAKDAVLTQSYTLVFV